MELRLKRNALHYSTKFEVCTHSHVPYSGRMPLTGSLRCTMCNMIFNDSGDIKAHREYAQNAILTNDPRIAEMQAQAKQVYTRLGG